MHDYTEDQVKDVREREAKALETLKELQLTPACMPQLVNLGEDVFGIKLHPFLNDTKYASQPSPIQKEDLPPEPTNA